MTPIGKQIAFLENKRGHLDNDLFKLIAKDLIRQNFQELFEPKNLGIITETSLNNLRIQYTVELVKLRIADKKKSKQIDIEDAIRDAKKTK